MRIMDIIKLSDKNFSEKKKFAYPTKQQADKEDGVRVTEIIRDAETPSDTATEIQGLYRKHLSGIHFVFDRAAVDFSIAPGKDLLQYSAKELVDNLTLNHVDIMSVFMKSENGNYLYSHSTNVVFLSVMVGIWLKYNKSDLIRLAIAAMLHDIGMIKVIKMVLTPNKLNFSERKMVQQHNIYSRDFVAQISDIDEKIIEAVYNHHRRLDDTPDLNDYAQIIGLVDIFEALTHPRLWRKAQEPHYAVQYLIEKLKKSFRRDIIKTLIDNIGIYPTGTWVRLDTEEIGLVIDTNSAYLLSPKINIMFDRGEKMLLKPRIVDLLRQKNIHIKGPLEENTIQRLQEVLSK